MTRSVYVMEFDPPESGFVMVPNAMLEDRRLSAEAKCALVWMASKPRGFRLSVEAAQEALGVGRDKWQRIARELRLVGALERIAHRDGAGRISVWRHRISWAPWLAAPPDAPRSLKTRNVDSQKPEKPVQKGKERPENPVPYKDYSSRLKGPEKPDSGSKPGSDAYLADMINGSGYVPPSLITPTRARGLVQAGLVSLDRMRERQLL